MAQTRFDTEAQAQLNAAFEQQVPAMATQVSQANGLANDIVAIVKAQAGINLRTNVTEWSQAFDQLRQVLSEIIVDLQSTNTTNIATESDTSQVTSQRYAGTPLIP